MITTFCVITSVGSFHIFIKKLRYLNASPEIMSKSPTQQEIENLTEFARINDLDNNKRNWIIITLNLVFQYQP